MRSAWLAAAVALMAVPQAPSKDFTPQQRRWWAFQKVVKPAVPITKDRTWVRNDMDAFILAKLEEKGIKPAPPADKITLLRRATLDLTGLLPTPEEVQAVCWPTIRPRLSPRWWTACSIRRATANAGRGTGSTWPATPTAKASRATKRARTSGAIATTSSTRSTRTSRTTGSCASRSPATSCTPAIPPRSSPPASTGTSPTRATRAT